MNLKIIIAMNKIETLSYPEVKSLTLPSKKLIVFLHGVGSDGHDLISLVPFFQRDLPDCHFISPHGIESFDMAPFGRQWFSLQNRDPKLIKQQIDSNSSALMDLIKAKQQELNLSNNDTIVIGFSQGTMIGLYINFIQKEPFDKFIGFSGRLIPPNDCVNKETPICLIHGEQDEVVPEVELHNAANYLSNQHIKHVTHTIPNLAHSIDNKGINFAIEFIKYGANK